MSELARRQVCILISFIVFVLSLLISPYYTIGDQLHYRKVFEVLPTLGFIEGFEFYRRNLSSIEPVYYTLSWLVSRFLEKDLFTSVLNAILAFYSMRLLIKWKASVYMASLIIVTNFYFLVLFFAAERLKLSLMFLTMALISKNRLRLYSFSILSVFTHAQTFVVYGTIFFHLFVMEIKRIFRSGLIKVNFIVVLVCLVLSLTMMSEHLLVKLGAYLKPDFDLQNIFRLFAFYILALVYSRNRKETTVFFIPLFLVALAIGGERVNLYGYFVFLYYALPVNKGINAGVLVTSAYFINASYGFMVNIFQHGNGFYAG